MGEVKYRIDKEGRLVVSDIKNKVDGSFSVDDKNRLVYFVSESEHFKKKYSLPSKITFEGKWSLDPSHNLIFTLSEAAKPLGFKDFVFKGEIIDVSAGRVIFTVASRNKRGTQIIRLLKLKGRWQADKANRLTFLVKKTTAKYDRLTFENAWQVNKRNSIVYRYKKTYLKTKQREEKNLTLKGYWDISEKNRISYVLSKEERSGFSFKAAAGSPSLIGRKGIIKYRLGIGLNRGKLPSSRTITLYGKWKFGRGPNLSFEIDYGEARIKAIEFGASITLMTRNNVSLTLKGRRGKDLGIGVIFSRQFLKSKGRSFLQFSKAGRGFGVRGGLMVPW